MQNEQQTENQLEIQGFMKEWNNQRNWLLNQVRKSSEAEIFPDGEKRS